MEPWPGVGFSTARLDKSLAPNEDRKEASPLGRVILVPHLFRTGTRMASSPASGSTSPGGARAEKEKTPGMNMYNVMLILAFIFLLIGSLALFSELARYGYELRPGFKLL